MNRIGRIEGSKSQKVALSVDRLGISSRADLDNHPVRTKRSSKPIELLRITGSEGIKRGVDAGLNFATLSTSA